MLGVMTVIDIIQFKHDEKLCHFYKFFSFPETDYTFTMGGKL